MLSRHAAHDEVESKAFAPASRDQAAIALLPRGTSPLSNAPVSNLSPSTRDVPDMSASTASLDKVLLRLGLTEEKDLEKVGAASLGCTLQQRG